MMRASVTMALLMSVLLAACAPTSTSRITLLPETGGKASAVELKTSAGATLLTRPYQTASTSAKGEMLTGETSMLEVRERHKLLLSMQPTFTLYFESNRANLIPKSQSQLVQMFQAVAQRPGSEIIITGYGDTVGSQLENDVLSLARANAVRDLFLKRGFKADLIQTMGRGKRDLAVPTAEGVTELKNRRVEIVLR